MANDRPTWAEVDLGAIAYNVGEIGKRLGRKVRILGAVKADGYGHGAIPVSGAILGAGAEYLGVAGLDEALELRGAGLEAPILIFGSSLPEEAEEIVRYNLTATVGTEELASSLARLERERGKSLLRSKSSGRTAAPGVRTSNRVKVHIEVDTGMGRGGVYFEEVVDLVRRVAGKEGLEIEGIWTHFPSAEEEDRTFSLTQIERFRQVIACLEREGINIPLKHMANSAAILSLPESYFNLVRPGLILYGLYPSLKMKGELNLRPALSLKTKIVYLKKTPPGRPISYGRTYITPGETVMATLPIGYGDGYSRFLSNKGEVLVKGKRAPVRGRICMDQTLVEVGHIPGAKVGEEVVLIGKQGQENITVEELAERIGTVPHEIVSRLGKRVPRVYPGHE